jgi:drug/metabolite transporter (DMT)-like permease
MPAGGLPRARGRTGPVTSPFLLALASGAAHAAWNALAKTPGTERAATWVALAVSFGVTVVVVLAGGTPMPAPHQAPWLVLAGLGEAAYVFALGMAYARGDLALTYAVSRATALVVVWPLSFVAFATVPTVLAVVATVLVVLGTLLARRGDAAGARWHPGWTLATGAAVAVYHTGYKGAVDAGTAPATAFVAALALALPLLLAVLGPTVRAQVPALVTRPRMLAAGGLCAASFLAMLVAMQVADSGRILGVRNSSVGFALVIALVLGERPARRQWLGLVVLGTGITCFAIDQATS